MRKLPWKLSFAILGLMAIGCGPKTNSAEPAATTPTAAAPKADAPIKGPIEVVAFRGGYGIDFYEKCGAEFQSKHPETTVKVSGDPRVWEQLRPRFVKGDVPDLVFPGWGMDQWALKEDGQLMPLDDALKTPGADGKTPWGETFEPGMLKLGQLDGKQWVLPYYYSVFGWWFDPGVFTKNGWSQPKTFPELLALCAKIKAKGIAPITFQGKYPYYMIEGMLLPWANSIGGADAVRNAQNMEPGAWNSDSFLRAAEMIDQLNKAGYFQQGAVSMTHTESQQEFLQGHAAMIPCGTWLESEMKNQIPKGAKMQFMLAPVVEGGKGDPTAVMIGIEPWMVPTKAKNPQGAIAFFKYMTSPEKARQFVTEKGTLMAIKGTDSAEMPETLKAPAAAIRASTAIWSNRYRGFYPEFQKELENAMTSMINGQLTPKAFVDRVEAAAEKVRNDSSIKKHKID